METGDQRSGWEILTPNEVEVLKKVIPANEPEVLDALNKGMLMMRNDDNVPLEEKVTVMLNVIKAVVFMLGSAERNDIDVSVEEERCIVNNLTDFAWTVIKSFSLKDALIFLQAIPLAFFKLVQTGWSYQPPSPGPSGPQSS